MGLIMECSIWFSLLEEATLVEEAPDFVAIETPVALNRPRMTFTGVTDGLRSALMQLQGPGISSAVLMGRVLQTDGMAGLAKLNKYLQKLGQYALLQHRLFRDGVLLASIRPLSIYYRYEDNQVDEDQKYVLSRFAYLRNDRGRMILECPLGHAEVQFHAPVALTMVQELTGPRSVGDIAQRVDELNPETAGRLMNFLANARALVPSTAQQPVPEADSPVLAPWDFHDLLFHSRSRLGRHDRPYGGTYPFRDVFAPLPVVKAPMSSEVMPLYRPDIEQLRHQDAPFTEVLEKRASIREQDDTPMRLDQLGEFLYRSARIKRMSEEAGVSFRPYPGGGALHELEIYPLIDRCQGLQPGLYHYDPLAHQLGKISAPNPYINTLLRMAGVTARLERPPQVLLTIAARFQRVQLKYQSMTYAVILKNVGGLYQTMYLVATSMGLAPCALGGGHSDLFAQATGLNYLEETSVGEFILGSRKRAS